MDDPAEKPYRHHSLDWLRVLVILNLIPFHAAWLMAFVKGFSHIPQDTFGVSLFKYYIFFTRQWHMALLFFISGAAACMALSFRSPGQYVKERLRRLLIPFVFFMLFLHPLWVFYWPTIKAEKSIAMYFLKFWPYVITHIKAFGWMHMWFVVYLLICSFVSLPIFICMTKTKGRSLVKKCADLIQVKWLLFLPGIALSVIWLPLSVKWPYEFGGRTLITDWTYFSFNLTVFILGFITYRSKAADNKNK
jgi:fucose 4-O-acetylase-like acetyltransferase